MADLAHQGRIGREHQLVVLKFNYEIFVHFVFICLKSFKNVQSQLCSILLGLGQATSHMWYATSAYKEIPTAFHILNDVLSRFFC